jgi:phosphoadenosine phosphosulfate reductase
MISKDKLALYQEELKDKSAEQVLKWAFDNFNIKKVALATSLSIEDQVLTDMIIKINPEARIFTLDTGRLFEETYQTIDATCMKYKIKMEILFPDKKKVEKMVNEKGINLFYESVDNRKLCCNIRKVESLKAMLSSLDCWITGLRREQSVTRADVKKIEWDDANNIFKLNPLADWSEGDVWNYIKENNVPYNKLQDRHFPSIGCAPCTRAIKEGEDIRAGRWWWENPEHKECGLHIKK